MPRAIAAGIYVRISDDRLGDSAGVGRQEQDCRALAARQGWTVSEVYAENDTSAFKRKRLRMPDGTVKLRVVRPVFRRLLDDLASGTITGLVAYDLDRIARDPRDLEDLIDVIEGRQHVPVRTVTGGTDLSNDNGIMMARIMVGIANKSSRDTSRRVERKHLELAEQGRVGGGGIRSYGYARDGLAIVDSEAAIIRELAERVIAGDSLSTLAADLTARKIPTVLAGTEWNARSVHSVVSKGRNAGLREHKGEVVGPAVWPAIINQETWQQVKGALANRAAGSTNTLRFWLTGVLICSLCGRPLIGSTIGGGTRPRTRYWCATPRGGCGKIAVDAAGSEDIAGRLIVAYLSRPDVLANLAAATSHGNARQARRDAADDETQLAELAAMWAPGRSPRRNTWPPASQSRAGWPGRRR